MDKNVVKRGRCFRLAHGALAISLCWTLIAASSIFWNLRQHNRETRAIVLNVAKTHLEKDTIFRRWGVGHGGVYVPATPQTQ
ncbi:MAG: hypothetical protein OEV91_07110, partial [Desulfobulbaceae bacterium]|nr:hypothetical protein [Desulfobulbaceae bacterium]